MRSTWRDRDRDFREQLPSCEKTTERDLQEVMRNTTTDAKPLPGLDPDHEDPQFCQQDIDCDEVFPGIYIGNAQTAKNKKYLKLLGITHILNAAEGKRFGFVNTDKKYYEDAMIKYLGIPIADLPTVNISVHFHTVAAFIDEAISAGGKVFVHCMLGVSRSATCVLAYLMIIKNMLAIEAIKIVRKNRGICPNIGFLQQLAHLDNNLKEKRLNCRRHSELRQEL